MLETNLHKEMRASELVGRNQVCHQKSNDFYTLHFKNVSIKVKYLCWRQVSIKKCMPLNLLAEVKSAFKKIVMLYPMLQKCKHKS